MPGPPIYPDLQVATPDNLSFGQRVMADRKTHFLVLFDTQIENRGGPLEIVADLSRSRDLSQNVYDALSGGAVAVRKRIAADLVFHPQHNHFHFANLSSYRLLKKNASGVYRTTPRSGTKTSVCIVDSVRVSTAGPARPTFTSCDAKRQGLDAGWADIYAAGLYEQWINLGTAPLADGDYAVSINADPLDLILESDDRNNGATAFFAVRDGLMLGGPQLPYCAPSPKIAVSGEVVRIGCERLPAGETFDLFWKSLSSDPIATLTTDSSGAASADFAVPGAISGVHYVYVKSRTSASQIFAIVQTAPDFTAASTAGPTNTRVTFTLTGFSANDRVAVTFARNSHSAVTLATVTTDAVGGAAGSLVIPSSVGGPHDLVAAGTSGPASVSVAFTVQPSLRIAPAGGAPGSRARATLRGFAPREPVTLTLAATGAVLLTIKTSATGSAGSSSGTEFTIPAGAPAGAAQIVATGAVSGAVVTAPITVASARVVTNPTVAPSPRATAGAQATSTPAVTPSPTEAAPSSPTTTPALAPTSTPTPTPTLSPTSAPSPTEPPTPPADPASPSAA